VTATANAAAATAKVQEDQYRKEREKVHLQLSSQQFISQHREQELVQEIGRLKARLFESNRDLTIGYFIVALFCYIYSFLLFVWLFFFTYALLAIVYVSHVEDRLFNTPRL
jgi:hypothetical protein